jgi:hypothetical protein
VGTNTCDRGATPLKAAASTGVIPPADRDISVHRVFSPRPEAKKLALALMVLVDENNRIKGLHRSTPDDARGCKRAARIARPTGGRRAICPPRRYRSESVGCGRLPYNEPAWHSLDPTANIDAFDRGQQPGGCNVTEFGELEIDSG